jgi:hypothetical protein
MGYNNLDRNSSSELRDIIGDSLDWDGERESILRADSMINFLDLYYTELKYYTMYNIK